MSDDLELLGGNNPADNPDSHALVTTSQVKALNTGHTETSLKKQMRAELDEVWGTNRTLLGNLFNIIGRLFATGGNVAGTIVGGTARLFDGIADGIGNFVHSAANAIAGNRDVPEPFVTIVDSVDNRLQPLSSAIDDRTREIENLNDRIKTETETRDRQIEEAKQAAKAAQDSISAANDTFAQSVNDLIAQNNTITGVVKQSEDATRELRDARGDIDELQTNAILQNQAVGSENARAIDVLTGSAQAQAIFQKQQQTWNNAAEQVANALRADVNESAENTELQKRINATVQNSLEALDLAIASNANSDRWAAMKQMQLVTVAPNETTETKWGTFTNNNYNTVLSKNNVHYNVPGTWQGKVFLIAVTDTGFVDTKVAQPGKTGKLEVRNNQDYYTSVSIFILPEYGPEPREWLITRQAPEYGYVTEKVPLAGETYKYNCVYLPVDVTVDREVYLATGVKRGLYKPGEIIPANSSIMFASKAGRPIDKYVVLREVKPPSP